MGGFVPGQILGDRYQILEMLGRGGMGEVWHAFDLKLRVEVALKALRPEFFKSERRLELLRQEVRAAREVMSPNVCRIFDLIEIEGRELVSMEYVDGATLLGVLQERGPLELKEAQDIASQFLAGLEAIHKVGLVHRDIKPENIMLTRAGRVVVMDFGLARQEAEGGGSVSGTPAYMAPEQAAGQTLDARADVYAAGVVLAEMVSPEGIKSYESRQSVWEGVRSEPAKLPDSPWAQVLKKAVAKDREGRYNTARTLTRALEDVTLRVEGAEDLHPYPGLASFTEEDAEYFFGREAEVEQMWRKLEGPTRMLALVGPSGAGKTSFLQAGLFPAATPQWAAATCKPGNNPQLALGRALAPEMAGDTEVMELLLRFDDPEAAVEVLSRWRCRSDRALLVVDQFEELFTQNSDEEQRRFADLLNRLVLDADVCVLLSMRDDFMIRCRDFEAFKPTFSDMTAIPTLAGNDLRRALVRPATKCGYRFEDDELVEEMLAEVEGERGALPLLAFAASQLWEKRDRETGLLTREAYQGIGGVGGALAQHAEASIDRIGTERIAIVRELFRNLVTAEGTRAVREWDELLSVFDAADVSRAGINPAPTTETETPRKRIAGVGVSPARDAAEEVLRGLINARLLTSYEVREEDKEPTRRVEIIHESLLANWPRLVRWQTQDADAAQLRDQLRQAARTWYEQGRSDDTLWTGSAYREFAVWRESYPGGLSDVEEAFADAMTSLSTRRRRRRRVAVAAGFAVLLAVLAVVGTLWRRSVLETRRAEAGKLLALAQAQLEPDPTGALAYTRASLDLFDTPQARRFALEVLWSAPVARILPVQRMARELGLPEDPSHIARIKFSPDGGWLVTRSASRRALLFPSDGGPARALPPQPDGKARPMGFGPRGEFLITEVSGSIVRFLSLPDLEEIRSVELGSFGIGGQLMPDGRFLTWTRIEEGIEEFLLRAWSLPDGEAEVLGTFAWDVGAPSEIDPSGAVIAYKRGRTLLARPMPPGDQSAERILGEGRDVVADIAFSPAGDRVAALDRSGEIRVWPTAVGVEGPLHVFRGPEFLGMTRMIFGPKGRTLVQPGKGSDYLIWDLDAPPDSEPVMARRPEMINVPDTAFDPVGRWLVTSGTTDTVTFWPLRRPWRRVLRKLGSSTWNMAFMNEGRWLATCSIARPPRLWPLTPEGGGARDLAPQEKCMFLAADPERDRILVNVQSGKALLLSTSGELERSLAALGYSRVALDPAGDRAVINPLGFAPLDPQHRLLWEWDLRSGEARDHSLAQLDDPDWMGFGCMDFAPDGSLYGSGPGDVLRLVLPDEPGAAVSIETIFEAGSTGSCLSRDGRYLLVAGSEKTGWNHDFAELVIFDLEQRKQLRITTHGDRLGAGAFDPSGRVIVTGDWEGVVRVGPVSGEEPHLLLGHTETIESLAVSPDGRWIASAAAESFRLWPMPDVSKPPLHTLPHDELLAKLDTFTNLRAVRDEASATGWSLEIGPFPGWETVPEW
jgi:WD40 repeat protein